MSIKDFLKSEFSGFGKYERIVFPVIVCLVFIISLISKDSAAAVTAAVCGISYTILAGKGRVSCYFAGILGTVCYAYMSFANGFLGNFLLYACYYLPVEITGIFRWSRHLKKKSREIKKTCLSNKERVVYLLAALVLSCILAAAFYSAGGKSPVFDAFASGLSVFGLLLTVKRCIEQWHIWFIVNLLTFIMWLNAYIKGSNCISMLFMWFIYIILAVYFYISWKKDMQN